MEKYKFKLAFYIILNTSKTTVKEFGCLKVVPCKKALDAFLEIAKFSKTDANNNIPISSTKYKFMTRMINSEMQSEFGI